MAESQPVGTWVSQSHGDNLEGRQCLDTQPQEAVWPTMWCSYVDSLACKLQPGKHRDKASGGSSCLPPVFISDWDGTATVTPHDSFSSLGDSLILKLPVLTVSALPSCPALSDSYLQSCLETPAAVRMPGSCHLPSAGLLRVLVSSCQLDGWATDKVERLHPSAGWNCSLKARVLKSFLQHGALCQTRGKDFLPLHTTPHIQSGHRTD